MWTLSWWVSVILCSQLLAAASTGSSRHDLPRIRPRTPQFGKGFGSKGFPSVPKGSGPVAKGSSNPPVPTDEPKDTKDPSPSNPLANALGEQLAGAIGGILGALATPPPASAVPTASAQTPKLLPYLEVLTTDELVSCRQYPDIVSPDPLKLTNYTIVSHLVVKCWTQASGSGPGGRVQGSSIWLKTVGGCYISEMNTQNSTDWQTKLAVCPPVQHWVGTLQTQYKRQDCYECTNTNCASKNLGAAPQVELSCSTLGEITGGNSTWVKSLDNNCYFPGAIFQPKGWFGSSAGKCPGS